MASAPESPTQAAWARISPDRKPIVEALCGAIRRGLGRGYDEGVLWGQLAWYVPLTRYPVATMRNRERRSPSAASLRPRGMSRCT